MKKLFVLVCLCFGLICNAQSPIDAPKKKVVSTTLDAMSPKDYQASKKVAKQVITTNKNLSGQVNSNTSAMKVVNVEVQAISLSQYVAQKSNAEKRVVNHNPDAEDVSNKKTSKNITLQALTKEEYRKRPKVEKKIIKNN